MALIARNLTVKGKMVVGVNPLSPPPSSNDVIPNALNWTNINGMSIGITNTQTISGISTGITLRIESNYNGTGNFDVYVNDVQYDLTFDIDTYGFYNHVVNNGDTIYFYRSSAGFVPTETVTVKNASDNNTILDTFTIDLVGMDP